MSSLSNKRILLGVTGGIAAYKSADLIRRLQDLGAEVRVVMTEGAQAFITPLTLQALSGKPVHTDLLDTEAEAAMGHIELAKWADIICVAPATADFIAKLAHGEGANLLTTLCLASKAMLALAPAMNQAMWANKATQDNMAILRQRGCQVIGPASGQQACGDVGEGRMMEPGDIAQTLADSLESGLLSGKTVMITAGPTQEAIDPVRYISNKSSGKMGYALAQAAVEAGAKTILVSGPVNIPEPQRLTRLSCLSALEMHKAVMDNIDGVDIFIGAAAVADFRPAQVTQEKIKKGNAEGMHLELIRNPDIIAEVAALADKPYVVGFAAETNDVLEHAREKRSKKALDMIIANDVSQQKIGFDSDKNEVTLIGKDFEHTIGERSKTLVAREIIVQLAADIE